MQISNGVKKNDKKELNHKVLFYTGISRAFRTTSIANLYEISQVFPVVLLSDKLDSETEKILTDEELFPKLEDIIPVERASELQKTNLFVKNLYAHKLAKHIIQKYKPTIVILPGDFCLFDIYLMRFAKKNNAINVVLNADLRFWKAEEMSLRTDLTHAYFKFPSFIPFSLRLFLARARKYCGYLFYNFFLPLSVGQAPFWGKSSRILYTIAGLRADFRVVFSKEDYNLSLEEGIHEEKIILLEHPLKRENTKMFFQKTYLLNLQNKTKNKTKTFTLLYPGEPYGFKRDNHSLIKEKEMRKKRMEIIDLIANTLAGWKIFIKPHPSTLHAEELKSVFEAISPFVTFTNPTEPIDKYVEMSDVVAGLPPVSSALFTASLQCPEKPVLSLDLPPQEILGDCYKNSELVQYVDNKESFVKILELIRDNKYHKERNLKSEGFSGTAEVIEYLLKNKKMW